MNLFSKQKSNNSAVNTAAREFGKTKKKKNTIIIELSQFNNPAHFALCPNTPLRAVKINGVELQQSGTGWVNSMLFPNPLASEMKTIYEQMSTVNEVVAKTIIEYLDKDTGKVVVTLFPHGGVTSAGYGADFTKHLNHATRQDLEKQIKLRQNLWLQYDNQLSK